MPATMNELLDEHLGDTEEIAETYSDDGRVIAVTNQRLIRLTRDRTSSGRDVVNAKALLLSGPSILGSEVESVGESEPNYGGLVVAGIFVLIGVVALLAANSLTGMVGTLAILTGLGTIVVAAGVAFSALQTDSGGVFVEVLSSGENERIQLPEGAEFIGAEVAQVVANQA